MNHAYVRPSTPNLFTKWSEEKKNHKAILDAAANAQTLRLQKLLQLVTNLDYTNRDGMTALHLAVQNGHMHIVVALLQAGADPGRQREKSCLTALNRGGTIKSSGDDQFTLG